MEKPQYSGTKKFQKRAFDICLSLTVLLGAAPVMIAAALAIKLTSPGPVFYRSERIGLDGKPFQMIKFRTMVDDADKQLDSLIQMNESSGGVLFKIREDPRVTKVGRILRKYSIDELPQFFNVLRRDMSVVGPRPPLQARGGQVRRPGAAAAARAAPVSPACGRSADAPISAGRIRCGSICRTWRTGRSPTIC